MPAVTGSASMAASSAVNSSQRRSIQTAPHSNPATPNPAATANNNNNINNNSNNSSSSQNNHRQAGAATVATSRSQRDGMNGGMLGFGFGLSGTGVVPVAGDVSAGVVGGTSTTRSTPRATPTLTRPPSMSVSSSSPASSSLDNSPVPVNDNSPPIERKVSLNSNSVSSFKTRKSASSQPGTAAAAAPSQPQVQPHHQPPHHLSQSQSLASTLPADTQPQPYIRERRSSFPFPFSPMPTTVPAAVNLLSTPPMSLSGSTITSSTSTSPITAPAPAAPAGPPPPHPHTPSHSLHNLFQHSSPPSSHPQLQSHSYSYTAHPHDYSGHSPSQSPSQTPIRTFLNEPTGRALPAPFILSANSSSTNSAIAATATAAGPGSFTPPSSPPQHQPQPFSATFSHSIPTVPPQPLSHSHSVSHSQSQSQSQSHSHSHSHGQPTLVSQSKPVISAAASMISSSSHPLVSSPASSPTHQPQQQKDVSLHVRKPHTNTLNHDHNPTYEQHSHHHTIAHNHTVNVNLNDVNTNGTRDSHSFAPHSFPSQSNTLSSRSHANQHQQTSTSHSNSNSGTVTSAASNRIRKPQPHPSPPLPSSSSGTSAHAAGSSSPSHSPLPSSASASHHQHHPTTTSPAYTSAPHSNHTTNHSSINDSSTHSSVSLAPHTKSAKQKLSFNLAHNEKEYYEAHEDPHNSSAGTTTSSTTPLHSASSSSSSSSSSSTASASTRSSSRGFSPFSSSLSAFVPSLPFTLSQYIQRVRKHWTKPEERQAPRLNPVALFLSSPAAQHTPIGTALSSPSLSSNSSHSQHSHGAKDAPHLPRLELAARTLSSNWPTICFCLTIIIAILLIIIYSAFMPDSPPLSAFFSFYFPGSLPGNSIYRHSPSPMLLLPSSAAAGNPATIPFTIVSIMNFSSSPSCLTPTSLSFDRASLIRWHALMSWVLAVGPINVIIYVEEPGACSWLIERPEVRGMKCFPIPYPNCWHPTYRRPLLSCLFEHAHKNSNNKFIAFISRPSFLHPLLPIILANVSMTLNKFMIVTRRTDVILPTNSLSTYTPSLFSSSSFPFLVPTLPNYPQIYQKMMTPYIHTLQDVFEHSHMYGSLHSQ